MSELSELGAVMASNIVAITGYIALFLKQRETEKKITNDHPLHLRDDLDSKHEKVVDEIESFRKELTHKLDVIERREITLLERIGAVEVNADREHSNIWSVLNKVRERMNPHGNG